MYKYKRGKMGVVVNILISFRVFQFELSIKFFNFHIELFVNFIENLLFIEKTLSYFNKYKCL